MKLISSTNSKTTSKEEICSIFFILLLNNVDIIRNGIVDQDFK